MTPDNDPDSAPISVYVRQAKPSEIPALVAIYARAFARDPLMNWFGGVCELVPEDYHCTRNCYNHDDDDREEEERRREAASRTVEALRHFQLVLVKMAQLLGLVVVVVERKEERVVGGALWLMPGASMDPSPLTFVRSSPWRALWS
jgi:hypothetical protein